MELTCLVWLHFCVLPEDWDQVKFVQESVFPEVYYTGMGG